MTFPREPVEHSLSALLYQTGLAGKSLPSVTDTGLRPNWNNFAVKSQEF